MPDDGSLAGNVWPMPKFSFDTLKETIRAGWPIGKPHTVVEGNSLKELSKTQYGSDLYDGRIAHYNGLNKYRDLPIGMAIYFPPLVEGA